jgi:hypothetical protein
MQRSNILQLLGPPQAGGYPLKSIETWYCDGVLGLRKLDVWYFSEEDSSAEIVHEYIFWRPTDRYLQVRREKDPRAQ